MLVAIALFGAAVAGLMFAYGPVHEALFRLSDSGGDAGDLEIVKAVAESSRDRTTLLDGGDAPLPGGGEVRWHAELESTGVEALFTVRLFVDRGDRAPMKTEYLRFEPRWLLPTDTKPEWLPHNGGTVAAPAGGAAGRRGGGRDNRKGDQGGRKQNGGQNPDNRGGGDRRGLPGDGRRGPGMPPPAGAPAGPPRQGGGR